MSYDSLRGLGLFKQMVDNNRVILASLQEDPIQVCKCINPHQLEHLAWMLDECVTLYEMNWLEKANRWLGYVQGVLSARYGVSLEDLKSANRSGDG